MIYRLSGSHYALLVITLGIMLGTAGIMTKQIEFLVSNYHLNFIPAEIEMEENIAILIAAFGVFLEHRSYLLNLIYPTGVPAFIDEFDQYSHNVGVMFIFIAILIVTLDLFFLALNTWGVEFPLLKYFEILGLFLINLVALAMLFVYGVRCWRAYHNLRG